MAAPSPTPDPSPSTPRHPPNAPAAAPGRAASAPAPGPPAEGPEPAPEGGAAEAPREQPRLQQPVRGRLRKQSLGLRGRQAALQRRAEVPAERAAGRNLHPDYGQALAEHLGPAGRPGAGAGGQPLDHLPGLAGNAGPGLPDAGAGDLSAAPGAPVRGGRGRACSRRRWAEAGVGVPGGESSCPRRRHGQTGGTGRGGAGVQAANSRTDF
jgi:hypothetical protein